MSRDERWVQVAAVFGEAIDLPTSQRAAYLIEACGDDAELRTEVERLLVLHDGSARFLEPPAIDALAPPQQAPLARGARVGRFVIERHIATGGMGVVFEARQESPSRRVALKLIHPALVSAETVRRLSIESEALARLRHAGIAQLFEAGLHDFGDGAQPFIAMELVEGTPLLEHAATLDTRSRARLMAEIASAVQHAHQKGVLHRDLKPANILVDHDGRPRILDFGIARLVDVSDAPTTVQRATRTVAGTLVGTLVGTLQYMSPEQLRGQVDEIDTRSDIYALGVVAYEVFAGRLPFDGEGSSLVALVEMVTRHQVVPLGRSAPALRGDLEWIVSKAMSAEREQRYASAQEFADDLHRWLEHAPIHARPPSALYQLSKFARRHRAIVLGVSGIILALAVGMTLYAREAGRARVAEREAIEASSTSAAVSEFLTRMLARIDPNRRSDQVDLPTLVDGAAAEINELFANRPVEHAAVRNEVGTIYYNLRRFDDAEREFRRSMELREGVLGPAHADTLDAVNNLGQALASLGRREEAMEMYRRALDGRRALLGPAHPRTLNTLNNIAGLARSEHEMSEAATMLREAIAARASNSGLADEDALITLGALATMLDRQDKRAEALELRQRAAEGFTALYGDDHRMTAIAHGAVARSLHQLGRLDEAEPQFRKALAGLAISRGGRDHDTGVIAFRFGELLEDLDRHREAIAQFALARDIEIELRGPAHRNVIRIGVREAECLRQAGEPEAAQRLCAQLLESFGRVLSPTDNAILDAQLGLARSMVALGQGDNARKVLRSAIDAAASAPGVDPKRLDALRGELARLPPSSPRPSP